MRRAAITAVASAATLLVVIAGPARAQGPPSQIEAQQVEAQQVEAREAGAPQTGLPMAAVTIETLSAGAQVFETEVADTPQTRQIGMMFRREMADDAAMLFLYEEPQQAAFWMRNTLIPLDIVFIDPDGMVIRVHENARPLDETRILSGGVVIAALEIRGGLARELGIAPGDRVKSIALSAFWRQSLKARQQKP